MLDAQYALMQQLVPGETLQPNQVLICPTARATPSAFRMRVAAVLCTAVLHTSCRVALASGTHVAAAPLCRRGVFQRRHGTDLCGHLQLAMGQTYEQLDRGEEGRLGKRGTELPPIVRSESPVQ